MSTASRAVRTLPEKKRSGLSLLRSSIRRHPLAYLMLLPGLAYFLIFDYYPMYGLLIAFKDFKGSLGILGSP